MEGGVRLLQANLPAVVSVVSEANQPRYPTLLQVMVAGKKAIEEVPIEALQGGGYPASAAEVVEVAVQPANRKGVILEGSPEEVAGKLLDALKMEGVL